MAGYWKNLEETAKAITPDKWFKTGDAGYIDADGYLILAGRKKDIIIRGGANISPVQIEGLVMAHPDVVTVACVAVPQVLGHHEGDSTLKGDLLMLLASLTWAAYSVLVKKWVYDPWLLTRFVALASCLVFMPIYLLWLPKALHEVPTEMLVLQGLYQGLGPTILAMVLFLKAVELLGAERTGALVALVPVMAGLGAVPLLDEPLTPWLVAGLLLVSGGAFVAARSR